MPCTDSIQGKYIWKLSINSSKTVEGVWDTKIPTFCTQTDGQTDRQTQTDFLVPWKTFVLQEPNEYAFLICNRVAEIPISELFYYNLCQSNLPADHLPNCMICLYGNFLCFSHQFSYIAPISALIHVFLSYSFMSIVHNIVHKLPVAFRGIFLYQCCTQCCSQAATSFSTAENNAQRERNELFLS